MTLSVESLAAAGLQAGDEVTVEAEGPHTIVVRRVGRDLSAGLGVFDGL